MQELSAEEQVCLLSLKINHRSEELATIVELMSGKPNFSRMADMASACAVSAMLYHCLQQSATLHLLPAPIHAELKATATMVLARTIRFVGYYDQIAKAFNEAGIAFMPLKGMVAIDKLYKSYELRAMSDIDLLVQPEDAPRSLELLKNLGYSTHGDILLEKHQNSEVIHYPQLVKEGVCVELHQKLHRNIEPYSLPVELLFANSTADTIHNNPCRLMDNYDGLIYSILHLDRHFKEGHVQFTSIADIVNQLLTTDINRQTLVAKCQQYNCEKEVFGYLLLLDSFYKFEPDDTIRSTYGNYASAARRRLFLKYLNGYRGFTSGMPKHLSAISNFKSLSEKWSYTLTILFPPRSFMLSKFKLRNSRTLWFYYGYRWWLGVKGMFKSL